MVSVRLRECIPGPVEVAMSKEPAKNEANKEESKPRAWKNEPQATF